ncbi:helix-turn-helix domain-containing protein [Kribbella albertanoniae]|uniref:PucR family transcriptional regulator n=1 Tax=Kribbella albertanoniae TaxID=1266829 RepID=A0A4R4PY59_9ACTN|nr:helix-turn-helix domain-containing protein [Kribbella albertanoniae]TDC27353.1 PucR family transcriptional regulator [Kribbella albertanoniae]
MTEQFRIDGIPAHERLSRDLTEVVEQIVARHQRDLPEYRSLPPEVLRTDVTAVTLDAVRYYVDWLREGRSPYDAELARLASSAGRRSEEGLPLAAIQSAYLMGFEGIFRRLTAAAEPGDLEAVRKLASRLFEIAWEAMAAVTEGYLVEMRVAVGERNEARRALLTALLTDDAPTVTLPAGVTLAARYLVLAVRLGRHPDTMRSGVNTGAVERRMLRRLTGALDSTDDGGALTSLNASGGLVLVPLRTDVDWSYCEGLIERGTEAAGVSISAAGAIAEPAQIPAAASQVGQVLEVVRWFDRPPGLYRLQDVVVEYQLTRPGVARAELAGLLAPLEPYPDLIATLEWFVRTGQNRQQTASKLHVHPNTIIYRLRRITELTGLDSAHARGMTQLSAAVAARRAERSSD